MSAYCNQCGQYHESLTVCPNWKPITGMDQPRMDPERYNLVGDELRKLTMRVSDLASSLIKMEMDIARHVSMKVDEAFAQVLCNHELQVSLLNEIGLTLTAVAKEQVEQAETLKTYKLSLEGIQGLLVDLTHSLDVIAEVQANSYDAVVTKFEAIYKRLEPCKVCAGKRRVHALFERKALENKATTVDEIMAAHDGRKPRKAGKRKRVKR